MRQEPKELVEGTFSSMTSAFFNSMEKSIFLVQTNSFSNITECISKRMYGVSRRMKREMQGPLTQLGEGDVFYIRVAERDRWLFGPLFVTKIHGGVKYKSRHGVWFDVDETLTPGELLPSWIALEGGSEGGSGLPFCYLEPDLKGSGLFSRNPPHDLAALSISRGHEAPTGLRPWCPSFLRRNPPKHPPSLFELRVGDLGTLLTSNGVKSAVGFLKKGFLLCVPYVLCNGIKSAVGFLKKGFLLCVPYVLLFIARQAELTGNTSPRERPRLITW